MKKDYIKPEIELVKVSSESTLANTSGSNADYEIGSFPYSNEDGEIEEKDGGETL